MENHIRPSTKLAGIGKRVDRHGSQPMSASMLVEDYIKPAAIKAGFLKEDDGLPLRPHNEEVIRFGFHSFRHSLDTFMMKVGENPAVTQAIMSHSDMDMTLYYAHFKSRERRAALERYAAY